MKSTFIASLAASALMIGSAMAQQATSAVPTSPQDTNSGQNSADPAETGDTVVPGATGTSDVGQASAGDVTAIPGSPQATNNGQNSADPVQAGNSITPGAAGASDVGAASAGDVTAVPGSPQATNNGQNSADPVQAGSTTATTAGSVGTTVGAAQVEED